MTSMQFLETVLSRHRPVSNPLGYLRHFQSKARQDRREVLQAVSQMQSTAGAAAFTREAEQVLLDTLLWPSPDNDRLWTVTLVPFLEYLERADNPQLDSSLAHWPRRIALSSTAFEACARSSGMSARLLRRLAGLASSASGLAAGLRAIPEADADMPLTIARLEPSCRASFVDLLAATGIIQPSQTHGVAATWPPSATLFRAAAARGTAPIAAPIALLGPLPQRPSSAYLQASPAPSWLGRLWHAVTGRKEMSEASRAWLDQAVARPSLGCVWPRFGPPVGSAWAGPTSERERDTALLEMLAWPPPPESSLMRPLVRAVGRACGKRCCLPVKTVVRLARHVERSRVPAELRTICLEALLSRSPGRVSGLRARLEAMLDHEQVVGFSRRLRWRLRQAMARLR